MIAPGAHAGAHTGGAHADDFAGLASGRFESVAGGVSALAASGNPRAADTLRALEQRRLFSDGAGGLFIRDGDTYRDARTGLAATPAPDTLDGVRLNNHVRKALVEAWAELDVSSPDVGIRRQAATALYHRHDPAMLPVIGRALDREKDRAVRSELEQARAATILGQAPAPGRTAQRLDAVASLRAAGGLEARGVLASVAASTAETPAVRGAARAAVAGIDWRLRLWTVLQNAFYGLSYGSVLLLAATGLAITFGVMGVINMAHGEMMMIGAYVTWAVQQGIRMTMPGLEPLALPVAVPAAFVVCAALGVLIERGLIRFLYGRPLETLLATWGLSLILQQAVRSLFGPTNIAVETPSWLSGSFALGGMDITLDRLGILVFAALVLAGLMLVLRRTSLGLEMRAVTQNRRMAALMGIRTPRADALAFGLGGGLAGLAGVAVSQIDNVSPNLGQSYIIDSFMVVVFGGVGNLWGTLAAAATLGIGGKVLEPIIGAVSAKIAILVLVILYIQRHPRGMFPVRGRGIES
ncbi:urea ABC transporter permease subunit UrtB [Nguyenibacter sp. L1]|nr:urea ABC transporter permease subunit UrtB [Nguyenibacter sp. L1]WRH89943.1 urea ABC transporter permease subunit UrtB [Nguyenibacter sp. L1]